MTGHYWEERRERDWQRTTRWGLNSGRREHRCAICQRYDAIGADRYNHFIMSK